MRYRKFWFYKGNKYRVKDTMVKAKNPDTGKWFDAIRYTRVDIKSDDYVRDRKDFLRKFIPSELSLNDRVAIVSHGKFLGYTRVVEKIGGTACLEKSISDAPKSVPVEVDKNGLIAMYRHWEYYYYNEAFCKLMRIRYDD